MTSSRPDAPWVRSMFDRIAPRYDLVNKLMTFGLDQGWRRRAVSALGLPPGARVLDVGCGTGDFCRLLRLSGMRPVGVDLSLGMLRAAKERLPLVQADGTAVPAGGEVFDGVTSGFALRNVTDPAALLAEIARLLRPGGRLALLEIDQPVSQPARLLHGAYFDHVVPLIGGLLSEREAYEYLPRSTTYLPSYEQLLAMLGDAGFSAVCKVRLGAGAAQLLSATRSERSSGYRER